MMAFNSQATNPSSTSQSSARTVPFKKVAVRHRQGVHLTSQSKYIVENVRNFLEKEKQQKRSIKRNRVLECTHLATGMSEATVKKIRREIIVNEGQLLTPTKRFIKSKVKINTDAYDKEVIQKVTEFYQERIITY